MLPHLFQFSGQHRHEGRALQADVVEFERELKEAVDEIWSRGVTEEDPSKDPDAVEEDTWATRMAELERQRLINPLGRVSKPDVIRIDKWKMNLYDL